MNDPIDPRRRHVLAMMGALGAGALAGCTLSGAAREAEGGIADTSKRATLALPRNSIDVHAHFFNASDASVIGYLLHSQLHTRPRVQRFAKRMHPVLKALVGTAPSVREELGWLQSLHGQKLAAKDMKSALDRKESDRRRQIARNIKLEMDRQGVTEEFLKDQDLEPMPRSAEEIERLLDPEREDDTKGLALGLGTIAGVFRFMGCMLQERRLTLRTYQRGHGKRGISAVFGALVDFDHFYTDLAKSPMAEQVELHSLLARDGFMLPLIAYNPWTDLKTGGERLLLLRAAVEKKGFIGAKIYPPVGFRPYGNTKVFDDLDPAKLDETLLGFFEACADLGIPVMSHANSTQGRDDAADQNSDPDGWHALIVEMARHHKVPLLNLGHFGGHGHEGKDEASNDWPMRFAGLMAGEGGQKAYGDLGNWSELRNCRPGCDPLLRLAAAKQKFPALDERLMYGSDYFMMIRDDDWKDWPQDIARAVQGQGFDLDHLFHENAMKCFGLLPGGANRKRLEVFFNRQMPQWMV